MIPAGGRLCLTGAPEAHKTTLALEIAENMHDQGAAVVWFAVDEDPDKIQARRLQRRGLAPAIAASLPDAAVSELRALDFFVLGADEPLEAVWKEARGDFPGRMLVIVLDSLHKVSTVAGEERGQRERLDALLETITKLQHTHGPAIVIFTAEVTPGSSAPKGSSGIAYSATLHLHLTALPGSKVRVEIKKNRHGGKEPGLLVVDAERQRVTDPTAPKPVAPEPTLRERILGAVRAGHVSGDAIEKAVRGVRGRAVRAELEALKAARVLTHNRRDGYQIAAPP